MERPRQKGAKFTNKNIAADDKVSTVAWWLEQSSTHSFLFIVMSSQQSQ